MMMMVITWAECLYIPIWLCVQQRVPRGLPSTVRYLQLRHNNISSIRSNDLVANVDINILILDDNRIDVFDNGALVHMTNLEQVAYNICMCILCFTVSHIYLNKLINENLIAIFIKDNYCLGVKMQHLQNIEDATFSKVLA